MKIKNIFITCLLLVSCIHFSTSQNLLDILENEQRDTLGYVTPAFKMTRITFGHSTEVRGKNTLEIFVSSRFWDLPKDKSQSFVADKMSSRIALEYGVSDRLTFAVGATTFDGVFDSYLKYRLVSQKKGVNSQPFNITLFQGASYNSSDKIKPAIKDDFSNRLAFTSQVLISRKISSDFSVQLTPTFIHKELLPESEKPNFLALGVGARFKIGPHLTIVSEYYNTFNPVKSFDTFNPFGLGVNWELGDVLLQFMLTNARSMVEDSFIVQTSNNFNFRDPNINFGFNATYVIHFSNRLKKK